MACKLRGNGVEMVWKWRGYGMEMAWKLRGVEMVWTWRGNGVETLFLNYNCPMAACCGGNNAKCYWKLDYLGNVVYLILPN